jgi:hypothetical protein
LQTPPQSDGFYWFAEFGTDLQANWGGTKEGACKAGYDRIDAANPQYRSQYLKFDLVGGTLYCFRKITQVSNGAVVAESQNFPRLLQRGANSCPAGWYMTPAGCMATPPPQTVTPEQIVEEMAPKPLPDVLPLGVPYPLDPVAPIIFEPTPGDNPQAQPLRVPQGNPVPVPDTNPQQYRQPVTRWAHSPTSTEPWRMSADPQDVVGTDPQGMTQPQPEASGSPNGEKPEQFDLCKEHPDIIACQVFKPDELTPTPLVNKQVPLALNAEGGFPTGGSCPQPKSVQLMGKTFAFSMQPLCDFALGIKPLLIGFAWLSAALVFLGVARREN